MANSNEPLIKLEPGGKAPILSYNVPEPTTYSNKNFMEFDYSPTEEFFKPSAFEKPPETVRPPLADLDLTTLKSAVATAMKTSFADNKLFPNIRIGTGGLRFIEKPNPGFQITSPLPVSPKLTYLDPEEAASMMRSGKRLNIYTSMFGTLTYNYVPEPPEEVRPRLLLVETYRLSSFLGSYGAGRIVKTFSLLPGEKTKISIKSFLKEEKERKSASSILDSFTQESADDFEKTIAEEHSDKQTYEQCFEYYGEIEGKASWGFGSVKAKAGAKGGTNSAREEFAKNVSSSIQKHANKASAKRDVEINTSYEVKEVSEEETSIEREIENINLSRTLNFVFRQMNQEFISLLTLVDVRVAFFNGYAETRKEVTLPELDSLLEEYIVNDKHDQVRKDIEDALKNILDYRGDLHSDFIEERVIGDDKYNRVKTELVSVFKDPVTETEIVVPGIILSATKNVLRTEGVIVEALLGEGEALDSYATRLQELEVARREAEVARESAEAERAALLNQLVKDCDNDRAKLLVELTCPCGPERPELDINLQSKRKGETES